jgi:hypothetical protein
LINYEIGEGLFFFKKWLFNKTLYRRLDIYRADGLHVANALSGNIVFTFCNLFYLNIFLSAWHLRK